MPEPALIDELLWLAHEVGVETRRLVVLTEGSVSARVDEHEFLTKATGCELATLTRAGISACRTNTILGIIEQPLLDLGSLHRILNEALLDPTGPRAGVDAAIHALLLGLPGIRFVVQAQPDTILQILCSPAGERFADHRMFPDEIDFCGSQTVYVPYTDPGAPLAREIRSKLSIFQRRSQNRIPRLILIQNQGAIAIGSTAAAALGTMMMAEKAARMFVGASRLGGPLFLPPQHIIRLETRGDDTPRASTILL